MVWNAFQCGFDFEWTYAISTNVKSIFLVSFLCETIFSVQPDREKYYDKKPSIKVKKYKKCASAPEILKSSMSAKSYVRIFRTSPVWREHKSPDFLDKPCLAKTQKSGFFGVRILSKPLYINWITHPYLDINMSIIF